MIFCHFLIVFDRVSWNYRENRKTRLLHEKVFTDKKKHTHHLKSLHSSLCSENKNYFTLYVIFFKIYTLNITSGEPKRSMSKTLFVVENEIRDDRFGRNVKIPPEIDPTYVYHLFNRRNDSVDFTRGPIAVG